MTSNFDREAWMKWLVNHGLVDEAEVPGMLKQIEAGKKVSVRLASGSKGKVRVYGNGTEIRIRPTEKLGLRRRIAGSGPEARSRPMSGSNGTRVLSGEAANREALMTHVRPIYPMRFVG
jgi:hypothetical protein